MSGTGGLSHLLPRPLTYGVKDVQQIDQTVKCIRDSVMVLGRQLTDAHLSNPPVDPAKLMGYDQLYQHLITVLSSSQPQYPLYPVPQVIQQVAYQQPSQDSLLVNMMQSNTTTSCTNLRNIIHLIDADDRERVENDIFWVLCAD